MTSYRSERAHSIWMLPLLAALLPALGTVVALWVSIELAVIESCNPFMTGCVSVSRAARHGLANYLFRALVLPGAVLQCLTWMLCRDWLLALGSAPRLRVLLVPWLGALAAIFLVLYGTFLGTEGRTYRWLRLYGTIGYFGCTYLCLLIATGEIRERVRAAPALAAWRIDRVLLAAVVALLLIGLTSATVAPFFEKGVKDRIENVAEWWLGAGYTVCLVALALLWKRSGFRIRIVTCRNSD